MKTLSFLLPALWAIFALTQPASAQSNPLLILTEAQYNIYTKYTKTTLNSLPFTCPNHTNACCNCLVNDWKAIIGKSTDKSITTITQEKANKYLQELFVNKGLLDDVKKLTHWPKDKDGWDAILSKRAIVLRTTGSDPNNPGFVASSICYDHKINNQNWHQILTVNVTKMAQKKRWCFKDGGIDSSGATLRTTLVHEMGHQYALANYPDLHFHKGSDPALVEKLVRMCQEAFAVYTEYRYLQQLAKKGEIANFNFKDFLDDACNKDQAVQACYKSLYNVDLAYMYYFLCGLDWDGEPDESGCPPLDYKQLVNIANACEAIRNNDLSFDCAQNIKIQESPLPIELLTSYLTISAKFRLWFKPTLSRTNRILQLNNQLAAKFKIDDFADLQTIAAKTPTNKTVDQYREEYKKVSPDIRKQTFQVMLEYLSANQYMK